MANYVVAMCSSPTKLYAATSDNKLWSRELNLAQNAWNYIGTANNVTALAYGNGILYCTDKNNTLWNRISVGLNMPWSNIGSAYNITGMTLLNDKLYATDKNNLLWIRGTVPYNISWTNIGHANEIRSLTNDGNNLIAISKYTNDLWIRNILPYDQDWLKIGTPNNTTYDIYLSNIAYANNTLFASSTNNKLYYSRHNQSPIYATVSFFEKNSKKALIINLDLCGIDYSFVKIIKNQIKSQFNIDENSILINCTHTHFAPVSQESFSCMQNFYQKPDPKYLLLVKNAVIKATLKAIMPKEESNLSYSKGKTDIGYNRADFSKNIDDNITMVISRGKDSNIINGIISSASAHPVWHEQEVDYTKISSNYIGITREKLQFLKGSEYTQLLQGCAGDINPYNTHSPNETANILASDLNNLFNSTAITGDITAKFDSIKIPINNFTYQEVLNIKNLNINNFDQTSERNVRWANKILNQYATNTLPINMTVYLQILKIGDWNIIALSREAVSQYAIDLYKIYNNKNLTVIGYSNDVSSYLPVNWHINKPSPNYEGYESFLLYGQSGIPTENIEDLILDKIFDMMQ